MTINEIKSVVCECYCRKPLEYSKGEWEQMIKSNSDDLPCKHCILDRLEDVAGGGTCQTKKQ